MTGTRNEEGKEEGKGVKEQAPYINASRRTDAVRKGPLQEEDSTGRHCAWTRKE